MGYVVQHWAVPEHETELHTQASTGILHDLRHECLHYFWTGYSYVSITHTDGTSGKAFVHHCGSASKPAVTHCDLQSDASCADRMVALVSSHDCWSVMKSTWWMKHAPLPLVVVAVCKRTTLHSPLPPVLGAFSQCGPAEADYHLCCPVFNATILFY